MYRTGYQSKNALTRCLVVLVSFCNTNLTLCDAASYGQYLSRSYSRLDGLPSPDICSPSTTRLSERWQNRFKNRDFTVWVCHVSFGWVTNKPQKPIQGEGENHCEPTKATAEVCSIVLWTLRFDKQASYILCNDVFLCRACWTKQNFKQIALNSSLCPLLFMSFNLSLWILPLFLLQLINLLKGFNVTHQYMSFKYLNDVLTSSKKRGWGHFKSIFSPWL